MVYLLRCVTHVCYIVLTQLFISTLINNGHVQGRRIDDEVDTGTGRKAYTNGWAIRIKTPHDLEVAGRIAKKHGFEKVTKVREEVNAGKSFELSFDQRIFAKISKNFFF